MDLKDKIAQRRKERENEEIQEHTKEREVAAANIQEKWEAVQVFNNASNEQKDQLIRDSLAVINGDIQSAAHVNHSISQERARFFIEAAANRETQSFARALIIVGLAISVYIGFTNSWLLAVGVACGLIIAFGSLIMIVVKFKVTNIIEKHRLKSVAERHLQT